MGSGTQHEHSGPPGKEEDKAASLLEKVYSQRQGILMGMVFWPGLSDTRLQVPHHTQYLSFNSQPGEGRDGVGISGGISPLFSWLLVGV